MRIAAVTTHPPGTGSLNEYAFHFIRNLRTKDEVKEITLLVDHLPSGEEYSFEADGVPVQVVPCWEFGALDNALRIRNAVKQINPDVVWFNIQFASFGSGKVSGALGLLTPMLVRMAGYPTIVLLHNIMETVNLKSAGFGGNPIIETLIRFFGNVVTRLLLRADLIAVTIPKYVEILESKYNAKNVVLAPHGSFDEVPEPDFELPEGPMQIMTFGKFGTYKKVDNLIQAFDQLKPGRPPLELVIAGSDSPNAPGYLDSMAETYAHVTNVRYTGYVAEEDVPRIFGDAAVVVFPYTSTTGSSGVLHQAGDYGKACVLPDLGDFAELITEEGFVGEFFEPDSVESLAESIGKLLDDPDLRKTQGKRNFMAARGLPIGEVVDWYLLHFETLLNEKK